MGSIKQSKANINISNLQNPNITGVISGDMSGYSVSRAGDVNGDGIEDMLISTFQELSSWSSTVYVIYGNKNLCSISLATLTKEQGFSMYSLPNSGPSAISNAGDVNNDGYDDIIIGTSSVDGADAEVYVVYGSLNLTDINLKTLTKEQGLTIYIPTQGYTTVSNAGDLNIDGYDDIIIGGHGGGCCPPNTPYPVVYAIYGGPNLNNINLVSLDRTQGFSIVDNYNSSNPSEFGLSMAGGNDINGDGYSDLIIGSCGKNFGSGITYVIYGGVDLSDIYLSSLTTVQGISIAGPIIDPSLNIGESSGFSVSFSGDVNKDGFTDITIGAPNFNSYVGKGYVIYGSSNLKDIDLSSMTIEQGFSIIGVNSTRAANEQWQMGYSVSSAGDINRDGYDDVIIGTPNAQEFAGNAYVVYGGTNLSDIYIDSFDDTQGFTISGTHEYQDRIGWSLSSTDIDGDGYTDLLFGCPFSKFDGTIGGQYSSGINYVVYGSDFL